LFNANIKPRGENILNPASFLPPRSLRAKKACKSARSAIPIHAAALTQIKARARFPAQKDDVE